MTIALVWSTWLKTLSLLRLTNNVTWLGPRNDVPAILQNCDIGVLSSISEGLPLALLEAMFAACPIVATDVGQVRSALNSGAAGLLVPPANSEALAAALDRLLSDRAEARRLGNMAALHAAEEYDLSRMVQRYAAVYEGALRNTRDVVISGARHASLGIDG